MASSASSPPPPPSSLSSVKFSEGTDVAALAPRLQSLLSLPGDATAGQDSSGRWALIPGHDGLERSFKFKGFGKAFDFMTAVSQQCKLKKHHPEWSNVYNTVFMRWTTHSPAGLSAKDVELAEICDELAASFGEVIPPRPQAEGGACSKPEKDDTAAAGPPGRALADRVVADAGGKGECCKPAKK